MDTILVGIVTDFILQPLKAKSLIDVYELLIVIEYDDGHPKKNPYDFTEDGIAVDGTDVPENANPPIYVTLVGIVIDDRAEHESNA